MANNSEIGDKIILANLNETQQQTLQILLSNGQSHLFQKWVKGQDEALKKALLDQAAHLNSICIGGLKNYIETCRMLLGQNNQKNSPLESWKPSVPSCKSFKFGSEDFIEAERLGLKALGKTAFVLVAGGLGERLGYDGIKLEIPCELTTGKCFFELYARFILSYQKKARDVYSDPNLLLFLAIMTSDDTHAKTVEMLDKNDYFGLQKRQVTLLKQEKVPAVSNTRAEFALESEFKICTKPHGHGDVHSLLLRSVLGKWAAAGIEHVLFFQDTNVVVFRGVPCLLGSSVRHGFDVNFLVVPRRPGEAVGSLCRLRSAEGKSMTRNVEYNVFESLLNASGVSEEIDEEGFSAFPGNVNVFVLKLPTYLEQIKSGGGQMPDYINPKFADERKTVFKSPARMECAMSDFSVLLESDEKVGCTQLERWLCFSAAKNNLADAITKKEKTGFSESPASAESDFYFSARNYLKQIGVKVGLNPQTKRFCGLESGEGAHVVLEPSFGRTFEEIKAHFKFPEKVRISDSSSLVLAGDIDVESLSLDGALVLRNEGEAAGRALVKRLAVRNGGWSFRERSGGDEEAVGLRGYALLKKGDCVKVLRGGQCVDES